MMRRLPVPLSKLCLPFALSDPHDIAVESKARSS